MLHVHVSHQKAFSSFNVNKNSSNEGCQKHPDAGENFHLLHDICQLFVEIIVWSQTLKLVTIPHDELQDSLMRNTISEI